MYVLLHKSARPETEVLDIAFSLKNRLLCMIMDIFTSYFISDVLSAFTIGGGICLVINQLVYYRGASAEIPSGTTAEVPYYTSTNKTITTTYPPVR